jgi:hypothetical protein
MIIKAFGGFAIVVRNFFFVASPSFSCTDIFSQSFANQLYTFTSSILSAWKMKFAAFIATIVVCVVGVSAAVFQQYEEGFDTARFCKVKAFCCSEWVQDRLSWPHPPRLAPKLTTMRTPSCFCGVWRLKGIRMGKGRS